MHAAEPRDRHCPETRNAELYHSGAELGRKQGDGTLDTAIHSSVAIVCKDICLGRS